MARVGGRNTAFAWIVGILCLAAVGGLAYLSLPMFPTALAWVNERIGGPTSAPVAEGDESADGLPAECRLLYSDSVWWSLSSTADAVLTPSTDAPVTTATVLTDALQPVVRMTCTWTSPSGSISTTLADVAPDAGAIAQTALPPLGFTCDVVRERTLCTRTDRDLVETIETGGGLWLSTSQTAWEPPGYTEGIADRVWPEAAGE